MKIAVVQKGIEDEDLRRHVLMHASRLSTYPLVREEIEDFYVWAKKVENYVSGVFPNVRGALSFAVESQDVVTAATVAFGVPERLWPTWPANFGQSIFVMCCCVVLGVVVCCVVLGVVCWCKVLVWLLVLDPLDPLALDHPTPHRPKKSLFFFPSPATIFFLCVSLSGVFSLNFGGVLKRRSPQMCPFGLSDLSCEISAALGPDFWAPPFGPTMTHTPDPWIGQRDWPKSVSSHPSGPHNSPFGAPPFGAIFSGFGHPLGHHYDTHQNGLAKIGFGQNEIGQSRSLPSELGVETSAEIDGQLFVVLSALTDGESFDVVMSAGGDHGFESWRKLHGRWDPYTADEHDVS